MQRTMSSAVACTQEFRSYLGSRLLVKNDLFMVRQTESGLPSTSMGKYVFQPVFALSFRPT